MKQEPYVDFKNTDFEGLTKYYSLINWEELCQMEDVEQMAEFATKAIQSGISKFTPTRLSKHQ